MISTTAEPPALHHVKQHLWEPTTTPPGTHTPDPLWYLRVSALKNEEGMGDCPSRRFAFKSLHHLTHATNQLDAAFGSKFDIRKCGAETPNFVGERVNNGRSENITIEFDTEAAGSSGWKEFLVQLATLESEWEHESVENL